MYTKCNAADIVIITIKLRGYGKNMTINEAGERYNIPIHILKLYESWAWCRGSVKAELLLIFIEVKRRVRNVKKTGWKKVTYYNNLCECNCGS